MLYDGSCFNACIRKIKKCCMMEVALMLVQERLVLYHGSCFNACTRKIKKCCIMEVALMRVQERLRSVV